MDEYFDSSFLKNIEKELKKVYIVGLLDNIIDSGLVVSFYVSSSELIVNIDQRVSHGMLTPNQVKDLESQLLSVVLKFNLKRIKVLDTSGRTVINKGVLR